MFLNIGVSKNEALTGARKSVLDYPGRHHPDTRVFRRMEYRLLKTWNTYYRYGSCECRSPSASTDTSQWRCCETQPWRRSYATAWDLGLSQTKVLEVYIPWRAVWSIYYSRNAHLFTEGRLLYLELRAPHVLIILHFPPSDVTRFRAHAVYFRLYFQQVIAAEGAPTRISIHSVCSCVLILSRVLTMVQYIKCGIVCSMNSVSRPMLKK